MRVFCRRQKHTNQRTQNTECRRQRRANRRTQNTERRRQKQPTGKRRTQLYFSATVIVLSQESLLQYPTIYDTLPQHHTTHYCATTLPLYCTTPLLHDTTDYSRCTALPHSQYCIKVMTTSYYTRIP